MRQVSDGRKFKFTDSRLEGWPPDPEREVLLYDDERRNLVCRVSPSGAKTFYFHRTDARTGRTAKTRIGVVGEFTVQQARDEVDRLNGQTVESGGAVPTRQRPGTATLGDAWENYIAFREGEGGRSVYQQRRMWALYLERFANVRMDAIDFLWVERNVKHAVARGDGLDDRRRNLRRSGGTYTANNVLVLLRAIFARYLKANKLVGKATNPVAAVDMYPTSRREEVMSPREVRRFLAAIDKFKREHCVYRHTRPGRGMFKGEPIESRLALADVLYVCVLTGQRRGAVAGMRWMDLRLAGDRQTWRIPPLKGNKSKKWKTVHLHPRVVELLNSWREKSGEGEYVFPGARGAARVKDPRKVFHKIRTIAGIENPNLTIHDLRAAFVTLGVASDKSTEAIAKAVGHDSPQTTTEHYARLSDEQARAVAMQIADAMLEPEEEAA